MERKGQRLNLIRSFSLFAQRKRTKRKGSLTLGPASWTSLRCSKRPGAAKLASLKQSSRLSGHFYTARLLEMAKTDKAFSSKKYLSFFRKVLTAIHAMINLHDDGDGGGAPDLGRQQNLMPFQEIHLLF